MRVGVEKGAQRFGIHTRLLGNFFSEHDIGFGEFLGEIVREFRRIAHEENDTHAMNEKLRERAREERFARAGGADEEDVALLDLDLVELRGERRGIAH